MSEPDAPSGPPSGADPSTDPFRQMAESAPIGLVAARPDGVIVFANAQWREITGIDHPVPIPYELVEKTLHPEDRDTVTGAYEAAGDNPGDFQVESRVVRPDGQVRHILGRGAAVFDEAGETVGFVGIAMDLTSVVELTAARQRSDQRYRNLLVRAPVGQLVTSIEGTIVEVNRTWAAMVGYETDELIGTKVLTYVHPDDHAAMGAPLEHLIDGTAEIYEQERRLLHRDGGVVWVSSNVTLERDAEGQPAFFFAVAMDITRRKAAEQALRDSEARYRKLIDEAPVGQVLCKLDGTLVEVNQAFLNMMGATATEIEAAMVSGLVHPDDAKDYQREIGRLVKGEIDRIERDRRLVRPDGRVVWVGGGTTLVREHGEVVLHSVVEDVTARKEAVDALTQSETRFRTLTESLPMGIYQSDAVGQVTYTNPQLAEVTGIGSSPTTWTGAMDPVHPDDQERVGRGLLGVLRDGTPYHDRYRVFTATGELRWLSNRATPTVDQDGTVTGIIGSLEDVTELVATQDQNTRLAQIVETASDLVGITDAGTGRLVYLNRSAREVFGLVDQDVTGVSGASMYAFTGSRAERDEILDTIRQGRTWTGELAMHGADGNEMMVWQTISPILRADGTLHQVSTVGRDVTERKRFEADLAHQATHDSLTGLPNRVLLLDHLELEMARAEREHRLVALLFLDLDRFKQVNDTLGHDAGDELLAQAAQRISAVVRPADTVARMGGDEFVILCGDVEDQDHATAVAHRVSAAIENRPFEIAGAELAITSSIGIALSSGGVHPEAILRDADAAMYRAKDLGRARLEIYDESMRSRSVHRLELSEELANGIENGEIVVRFQPGVDLQTGQVMCVEALARWDHPTRGLMAPHDFIGVAEDTGLIVGLGLRVLSTACEHGRRWENTFGLAAPRVHVNLSARQLTTSNLPVLVQGVLDGSGLTPSKLCLEITESVLMDDASGVIDTLWELKAIGVTLAIDDFGTGYSSLSYLRRFPVDVLKVDQSFVSGLGPDPEDSTIVAAIVNLANTLELEAIAEGVETYDQLDRLRHLGCRLAQGHYFAPADEADRVTDMILNGFGVAAL